MAVPDWRTYSGGSMKRAALWLAAEIGDGGVFTKDDLRAAFPGVGQIDRRVRDLRDDGWIIHTSREDVSLSADEQRLVAVGGRVWEDGYRRHAVRSVSAKERQAVLARDDYSCLVCGVSGGEPYPDLPLRKAKLVVARASDALGVRENATLCDRCHSGEAVVPDPAVLALTLDSLDQDQLERLRHWVSRGMRIPTPEERLFAAYLRLPGDAKHEFQGLLHTKGGESSRS